MDRVPLRYCKRCGRLKPLSGYSKGVSNRDGYILICKPCIAELSREWYWRKHPEGRKRRRYAPPLKPSEWAEVFAKGLLRCRSCGVEKPLLEFRKHRTRKKSYLKRDCRPCSLAIEAREREVKRDHLMAQLRRRICAKYGLTTEQFNTMLALQNEQCAICGKPFGDERRVIDHDHVTGKVRGIVHNHCNLMLGNSREDLRVLAGGIRYLLRQLRNEPPCEPLGGLLRMATTVEVRP